MRKNPEVAVEHPNKPEPIPIIQNEILSPIMENSFVTDLSMKDYDYSRLGEPPINPAMPFKADLTPKERQLTQELTQAKTMLMSLTPMVSKLSTENKQLKSLV